MNATHEHDPNCQLCADMEVGELMYQMRRTDAAPDDDALQSWHDAAPFLISMVVGLWIAVGVTLWRFWA